jgi:hypothetical protein
MLVLPEKQKGESWGTSKSDALSLVVEYGIEMYFRVIFEQLMQCNHNLRFITLSAEDMHLGFKFWFDLFKDVSFTEHHLRTSMRRKKRLMH